MRLSKHNSILAVSIILASTSLASAQSHTDIVRSTGTVLQDALKDPRKVRMLECLGITVYTAPPANWKAPSKAECDEVQKTTGTASPDRITPASDVSAQSGLDLQLGSLRSTRLFTDQPIALTNSAKTMASAIVVECGFFRGSELLDTARGVAEQVLPGQTAYIGVASTITSGVNSVKCRIVKWR